MLILGSWVQRWLAVIILVTLAVIPLLNILFLTFISFVMFCYLVAIGFFIRNKYHEKGSVFRTMIYFTTQELKRIVPDFINQYFEISVSNAATVGL
jgi:hypothetical protein